MSKWEGPTPEQFYGKGGSSSSAPMSKWGAPMPNPGASKEGGEGWLSWGLGLVGVGSAKKQPQERLHADGNPLHWARRYHPQQPPQQRLSSSMGSPAPQQQQQHGKPNAAHQTPTSSGTGFFNQPTMSNKTGTTKMSRKDYEY